MEKGYHVGKKFRTAPDRESRASLSADAYYQGPICFLSGLLESSISLPLVKPYFSGSWATYISLILCNNLSMLLSPALSVTNKVCHDYLALKDHPLAPHNDLQEI